jgi:hypothetical protein
VVAADVQFRLTANAAAAQYRQAPPYLAYHTVAVIDVPALKKHKVVERSVETRTADDFAVLQDLPRGQRQYGQSFPLIPTFDALSYFRIAYSGAQKRDLLAHVTTFAPITFDAPRASTPGVAVVATTLRNYYAQYADDSTDAKAHLTMDPLHALTQNNNSDFYIHDVYIDTATNLPLRVTYTGHDDVVFTVDYTTVQGHWLVSHVFYTRTFFAPLHIGQTRFTVDATFDNFTFPATPSDPKLLPSPTPAPPADAATPSGTAAPAAPAPAPSPSPSPSSEGRSTAVQKGLIERP